MGLRVVMFVYNDCRTDARVLREAASLVEAGHRVTIIARPTDPDATGGDREERDGFEIVRVPVPQAWRFYWTWIRYAVADAALVVGRATAAVRACPTGLAGARRAARRRRRDLAWAAIRLPFYLRARRRPQRSGARNLDWLVRWRCGVLGWAERGRGRGPGRRRLPRPRPDRPQAAGRARDGPAAALVYDSHEIFLESGSNAGRPAGPEVDGCARSERRWPRPPSALVTVNGSLASDLERASGRSASSSSTTARRAGSRRPHDRT